jgi:hypothetical protein
MHRLWEHVDDHFTSFICVAYAFKGDGPRSLDRATPLCYGAFTLDVKSVYNENLGGILGCHPMLNGQ